MKVLAGIDGTERSYHALELGSQLLSPKVDDLCMYFSPPKVVLLTKSDIVPELPEMAREALAKTVFDQAKTHLPEGFQEIAETIVGHSKPSDGILAAADQVKADLVIIGAHSATRRMPLFLGGSARKIAHHSERPVLLVRERQAATKGGLKVLIACDEGNLWRDAAAVLRDFSWPDDTVATLLHVVETMDEDQVDQLAKHAHPAVPDSDQLIEQYRSSVEQEKQTWKERLGANRQSLPTIMRDATLKVAQGHVVESIIKEVQEQDIDLVVVGARRLGRLGRWLGSTTEGLLTQCPASLLIVHEHEQP